ncbi:MAG: Smr/MutS family protein [Candidatus Zixiibacteriota bacterium]
MVVLLKVQLHNLCSVSYIQPGGRRIKCRGLCEKQADSEYQMTTDFDQPVEYPIDGTLDLHQFSPKETREVVMSYIDECLKRGIFNIRIVHGKGRGVQREIVHGVLKQHPSVASYRHEPGTGGGWGATVVDLKPS